MLGAMKIAVRDRRELRVRNPLEEVVAVAELETVDDAGGPLRLVGEARGRPVRAFNPCKRVGMRRDESGAGIRRLGKCRLQSSFEADETTDAEGEHVGAETRVGVVLGQLEPRNDERPVAGQRALAPSAWSSARYRS